MFVYNTLLGEIDFDYIWLDFEASVLLFMETIDRIGVKSQLHISWTYYFQIVPTLITNNYFEYNR